METFGELLRRYRLRSGKTQVELAEAIFSLQPFVSNFERGRAVPDRAEVIKIGQALSLPESATNELLSAANFDPLEAKTSTGKEEISVADIFPPSQVFNVRSVRSDPSREFEVQIRDIQDLLASLDQKIGSQEEPNELKNGLQQQMADLEAAVEELKTKGSELTAPIKLPELQKIAIKLIPTTSFEALEGHRADENRWTGVTTLFAGAALGIVINLATGATAEKLTWIVLAILLVVSGAAGFTAWRFYQRAQFVKTSINELYTT